MLARYAIVIALLVTASPAMAQTMNADAARRFIIGKLFAFNCFDGSRGAGRIYTDGSVIANLQLRGAGPARSMWMPAGTVKIQGEAVCAAVKGMAFEPCFNLTRTGDRSFRGAVSGMGFAYCDFTSRNVVASTNPRPLAPRPRAIDSAAVATSATAAAPAPAASDEKRPRTDD
jgi:hypothetical protein